MRVVFWLWKLNMQVTTIYIWQTVCKTMIQNDPVSTICMAGTEED